MADSARLEGVAGTSAAQKRGAGTVGGAQRTGPPRKSAGAAPGAQPAMSSSGTGGTGGTGRHAAARAGAKELMARNQAPKRPQNAMFELPPVFEAAVARQMAVRRRARCSLRQRAHAARPVPRACCSRALRRGFCGAAVLQARVQP
jgi:hypothetical protein